MDAETFVKARRAHWAELDRMLHALDNTSDSRIGHTAVMRLVQLYRLASSDLNRLRGLTANPETIQPLNSLVSRAYRYIYRGSRMRGILESLRSLIVVEIPAAFRAERSSVALAAVALISGAAVGALAVIIDPSNAPKLIPPQFFSESPRERVESIEAGDERISTISSAAGFGASLYTHNIRVAFLAFSLGALTIVLGLWILFYNGVLLGAVCAMYFLDGVQIFFIAWVGPHGALELPAILFGAAAGLRLGRALLTPGEADTGTAVRRAAPNVVRMLAGAAMILVLAGLIEGGFSQFSAKSIPYAFKIGVSGALFLLLMVYLFSRHVDLPDGGAR
ncbi:MAG: stage II sporulation protein M [Acidobacteria bacterium]|nr:stage II sporulation protein M [Acidobacteriota bacterium]